MSFSNCLKCGVPIPEHKTYCPPHEAEYYERMERERKAEEHMKNFWPTMIPLTVIVAIIMFIFYLMGGEI
jgi:predicted nucleic acid-binding Zn ribbon protein